MKKHLAILLFAAFSLGVSVQLASAQASGSVKGVCKDAQGNPIADAIVLWTNTDNGQKYPLKTNKKGEYFSLGVAFGKYNVTLYRNADDQKAGKEMDHLNGVPVQTDEATADFDMKKDLEKAAQGQGLTPDQMKQRQEQQAKQQKETLTVKSLNEKLTAAKTAADAGDFDTAIKTLEDANAIDPSRDLIWFKLGDYYRLSAAKQTDTAEKNKRLGSAVDAYNKAIELKKATVNDKDPNAAANMAAYYNNLAEAYAKSGKVDDAVKTYELSAQADPAHAAQAYFNTGAVLTNAGRADDALAAFDKCIAADPTRADAYYQKGVNLLGKATIQGDKTIPAPGTVEALQKYLDLAPTGPYAQQAKDLLASLNASIETSYGKKKQPPKKQ
jgi:tetratricopeptide (TPR) repeat protein